MNKSVSFTLTMPRITQTAFLKSLWRRHPGAILYHLGIFLFVIATLSRYGFFTSVSSSEKEHRKRDLEFKKYELDVDPSMPLDRVTDEELAKWIDELLDKRPVDDVAGRVGGDARGRKMGLETNDHAMKNGMGSVEILGEGGARHDRPMREMKREHSPNIPPGHLPYVKSQRQKAFREENKQAEPHAPVNDAEGDLYRFDVELKRRPDQGKRHQHLRPGNSGTGNGASISQGRARRANVLIVAAMRTGSSFLGELFLQRTDFFYMFEPGISIMHKLDSMNLTRRVLCTKLLDMINHFYSCQFNGMPFFIEELNQKSLRSRQHTIPALVTTQFCHKSNNHSKQIICARVDENVLQTACTSRAHTAIKSIRLLDINLLISSVKNSKLNLKLIHLVRDPRSMIVSRLKLEFPAIQVFNETLLPGTFRNILLRYCSDWLQNYEIGHYVPLMRRNYLMVRYEDLALEPYIYARKIYDFVGVGAEIPQNVKDWIDKNTAVNDHREGKAVAYSTKRDSKSVLLSWKTRITLEMAQAIEGVGDCTRLMKAVGYKLISDDYDNLKNNDHLVDETPVPDFDPYAFDFM